MLLAALQRRNRVAGLLGLAAAPDFTEELLYAAFTAEQKMALLRDGQVMGPEADGLPAAPITRALIEDGRQHLLLHSPIALSCPVRLIHGQKDEDVPWQTALRLAAQLNAADVEVVLVKGAGHRLNEPADLERLRRVLEALLRQIGS
jgi:pimeloyl-ACP methyl ester carboxylesterase